MQSTPRLSLDNLRAHEASCPTVREAGDREVNSTDMGTDRYPLRRIRGVWGTEPRVLRGALQKLL